MQKFTPCLWFDDQAEEAVKLYTSLFKNSKTGNIARYDSASAEVSGRPEGSVLTVEFELEHMHFIALNGGPLFKFTPATSFFVACHSEKEIDDLWKKLSPGGMIMMELDKYPFAKKYGWLQDKFGLSWQLFFNDGQYKQKITPFIMFVGDKCGKVEEAIKFYTSLFKNSHTNVIVPYEKGEDPAGGTVKHASYSLHGEQFMMMDSGYDHKFTITQAVSYMINCQDQHEVDELWEKLSKGGQKQPCGWVLDKYGVAWQVVPTILDKLLRDKNPEKAKRVMEAMLEMTKLDIKKLQDAYSKD